jgi:hypothetical protein
MKRFRDEDVLTWWNNFEKKHFFFAVYSIRPSKPSG